MLVTKHRKAIEAGIAYLAGAQLEDGSIPVEVSTDPVMKSWEADPSIFASSLAAYCLRFVDHPSAAVIVHKILDFLQSQMQGRGLWSYWSDKSRIQAAIDLDSTSCASLAFTVWERAIPSNSWYLLRNRKQDGRFYTWMPMCAWNRPGVLLQKRSHVDPVVNANVIAYLGQKETEAAMRYVAKATIADPPERSEYYPDPVWLYHAVSRAFYRGISDLLVVREAVVLRMNRKLRLDGENTLSKVMAAIALLNFNSWSSFASLAIEQILEQQETDGGWKCSSAYGGHYAGQEHYFGSKALTTVYVLEAVSRVAALA